MVGIACRNSKDLLSLINDLLDLQKLNSGKLDFDFETVEIAELLRQTCDDLEGFASEKGVAIDLVCHEIPNLVADPLRLRQALANLISNAVKFSPERGKVAIKAEECEETVRIKVTDYGPGIPDDFRSQLFEKFSQAKNPNKIKGTGLGLAITKTIVEAHNGSIGFDTEPGKETTFWICLPKRQTVIRERD